MEGEMRSKAGRPLSAAQERLWFLQQLLSDCTAHHIPAAWRLRGPLDLAILRQSLAALMERHEMLSTIFTVVDGQPVQQRVLDAIPPLTVEDVRAVPSEQREVVLSEHLLAASRRTFDLSQGPLWRALLLRSEDEEYVLIATFHQLIADDWSVDIFGREMAAAYTAFAQRGTATSSSPVLPVQYIGYAAHQRQKLQGKALDALLSYWRQQLERAPKVLELPGDGVRPPAQTFWSASYPFQLSPSLWQALQLLSQQEGVTPFITLLAAFQVLVFRYTAQENILVGTPISGRQAETENIIGPFADTLVLCGNLSGNPTFRELLARIQRTCVDAFAHQELPFARLLDAVQIERDFSRNPLVQIMFALQEPPDDPSASRMGELEMAPLGVKRGTITADLSIELRAVTSNLEGAIEYNVDLFSEDFIARLAEHYCVLLKGIVANPTQRISDLPILTEAERQQVLVEWNSARLVYPAVPLHRLFEAQAAHTPDAVALIYAGERLTYAELNRRANQVAHFLLALKVGPEIPVGLLLERSPDLVIGLLGILKAGGAYVPLDPAYPQERLAFTLQHARAPVLLTQQRLLSCLPDQALQACTVVCLDTESAAIAGQQQENVQSEPSPANLAYIIYTSGSTGQPKGVGITHHSAVIFLHWARQHFSASDLAGTFASTSICFDLSIFELFAPLSWGGTVILAENALRLPEIARTEWVTLVNTVPSAMAELVRSGLLPDSVHTINLAGEALSRQLVEQLYAIPSVRRVFNLYGPTEDTTYSTWALLEPGESEPVPIGRPLPDTQVYLLDSRMQPVPIGVPGELYLGGEGLARGYVHRPDLTAERFVPNPLSILPGARLYRTGDLARYRSDGSIDYLGRIDHQIKLRGFRIELGEIEACLKRLPPVQDAAVVLRRDHPDNLRLIAYVVIKDGGTATADELRYALMKHVPAYMLPSAFMFLPMLPLSPNGKVDRRALPAPSGAGLQREQTYVAPRNPTEELVAQIWAETLHIPQIGIHENFFKLGGHSLLGMRVLARLKETFQIEMPLQRFFERPTIASLCEAIEEMVFAEIEGLPDEDVERALSTLAQREQ